ncbi:zinc transporter ZIP6-like [Hoplias malabaricus]|uniref:zinc transporter ZIP6-like n=1 Tax=Hoplias malabaricus TaxID=27720 RepID=UPI003462240F
MKQASARRFKVMESQSRPRLLAVTSLLLFLVGVCGDCGPVSVETDSLLAAQTQQRHLQALFQKYGQNGSISLAGLQRLLEGVGLDRIRRVMVQHHGHQHNHTHSDTHTHKHTTQMHTVGGKKESEVSRIEKSDSTPDGNPDSVSGKKIQSDSHHNLYMKRAPDATTLLTTPTYASKSRRANRSANYNPLQDPDSAQINTTHTNHSQLSQETQKQYLEYHDHDHDDEHEHEYSQGQECQNASSLLQSHGMSQELGLSVRDFSFLCPALLEQIDSKSCLLHPDNNSDYKHHEHHHHPHHHHHHHHHHVPDHDQSSEKAQTSSPVQIAWICGFLAITVISLLALVGVVLIPLMNRVCFNFLLSFLVALAVGTLSGDAFLHLIPHSQGHHNHHHAANEDADHGLNDDSEDPLKPVWTGLTALSGVYVMFLIEHFLTLAKMYKDKKQKVQKKVELSNEIMDSEKQPALEDDAKTLEDAGPNGACELPEEEEVMLSQNYTDEDCENKCHSHFHDTVGQSDEQHHHHHDYHHILHHHHSQNHHPHTHTHRHTQSYSVQHFEQAGIATLAWMVIMGDGLHNFSDGLAIGAAFTEGVSSGLSTSVAVFCHELPHELGDFAVLLKAGMSVKQAILYNLLSALMGYLGMVTGILIGHYAENVATWIFALTAGLFMYVALVDMVPEMLHNNASEAGFSHYGFFLLQNAGILLGFGIMLLIAMFEHKIQLHIKF